MKPKSTNLHSQTIIAVVWDFDQTLIPGYMQAPLFDHYNIDPEIFWKEVNALPELYNKKEIRVSKDTVYLNHLLSHVKNGKLKGLNNSKLRELGKEINFYPGLPDFFLKLKELVKSEPRYQRYGFTLEHYIISTGLAEMIRGSAIAPHVDGVFGCELVEEPFLPGYSQQTEMSLDTESEVSQIGMIVDNTIKTRFIFEINKGSNKHPSIDVNSKMLAQDRRVPIPNMIYIADGPSDVPVFSVVKNEGGKTYAVYDPDNPQAFAQNDQLLQAGRVHYYGPADYTPISSTSKWITMHVQQICERMIQEREHAVANRVQKPPQHLHKEKNTIAPIDENLLFPTTDDI